jgi:hypothetical protein
MISPPSARASAGSTVHPTKIAATRSQNINILLTKCRIRRWEPGCQGFWRQSTMPGEGLSSAVCTLLRGRCQLLCRPWRIIPGHDSAANPERRIGISGRTLAGTGDETGLRALGNCDQGADREDSPGDSHPRSNGWQKFKVAPLPNVCEFEAVGLSR